jgi:hypothetical protein
MQLFKQAKDVGALRKHDPRAQRPMNRRLDYQAVHVGVNRDAGVDMLAFHRVERATPSGDEWMLCGERHSGFGGFGL